MGRETNILQKDTLKALKAVTKAAKPQLRNPSKPIQVWKKERRYF